jgi:hypothetical protein
VSWEERRASVRLRRGARRFAGMEVGRRGVGMDSESAGMECDGECIEDASDEVDLHALADFGGDFGPVFTVVLGEDDLAETGAVSGEDLFLDAADGEDAAAEADFSGHGEVGAESSLGEEGGQGECEGETGAGAVFGGGSGGDMDVEVEPVEVGEVDLEVFGLGAEEADGGLGTFLHDVAERAGEHESALAGHAGDFDEEDIAADGGPGHTDGDAGFRDGFGGFREEACGAEEVAEFLWGDGDGFLFIFTGDDSAGDFAGEGGDFAFELADSGFAGVVLNEFFERWVGELDLGVFEAVFVELSGDEVTPGYLEFFGGGIAGDLDDFEAVAEGWVDGFEPIGGGDEEDAGEIEGEVEVVVGEGMVLLGVEDFQESGGWVAAEVGSDLVDFVEEYDGVFTFDTAEGLEDAAGEGSDVGSAVAPDFGFVAHPA